jgi:integrating conjugative element protein (TIGR03749 family)
MRWERLPLTVRLVVGQERVIFTDHNVRVGMPAGLGEHLRVQSADGALYLSASAPFDSARVQLQEVESGALILLDVIAASPVAGEPPLEPIRIVGGQPFQHDSGTGPSHSDTESTQSTGSTPTPVPVVLTRYAAQSLYAPLRTVERIGGISRVPLQRGLALESLLPTVPVRARALASWQLEDYWVTAIQLTNTSAQWVELDPRSLQGDFVAATFQHPNLGPTHDSTDTTVLYLITHAHGLAESLLPVISPADASLNLPPSQEHTP